MGFFTPQNGFASKYHIFQNLLNPNRAKLPKETQLEHRYIIVPQKQKFVLFFGYFPFVVSSLKILYGGRGLWLIRLFPTVARVSFRIIFLL